ncbi:hypothetical protein Q9L58_008474 [Maublancomyces gigas]|uniref:Uncharacterized protein n=1 Tax=Discina gigas TaxID=1032678 RepID=A0ABR3G9Y3_9PEZI
MNPPWFSAEQDLRQESIFESDDLSRLVAVLEKLGGDIGLLNSPLQLSGDVVYLKEILNKALQKIRGSRPSTNR